MAFPSGWPAPAETSGGQSFFFSPFQNGGHEQICICGWILRLRGLVLQGKAFLARNSLLMGLFGNVLKYLQNRVHGFSTGARNYLHPRRRTAIRHGKRTMRRYSPLPRQPFLIPDRHPLRDTYTWVLPAP